MGNLISDFARLHNICFSIKGLETKGDGSVEEVIKGTGFFIDNTGVALTAWHVIKELDPENIEIRYGKKNNGHNEPKIIKMIVTSQSVKKDIAVLSVKLESDIRYIGLKAEDIIQISDGFQPGDQIIAAGYQEQQYLLGLHYKEMRIHNNNKENNLESVKLLEKDDTYRKCIILIPEARTDAILQGASGGPVFNKENSSIIGVVHGTKAMEGFAGIGEPGYASPFLDLPAELCEVTQRIKKGLPRKQGPWTGIPIPKHLTAQIPSTSSDKIIGRKKELEDLHQRLFDNKLVVLVNGLGGIGKTTLAQAYIGKYGEKYHHLAWISQLSDDIVSDFINTEGLLSNLKIESQGKELEQLFQEIMTKLKSITDKPGLLVIDNADTSLSQWNDSLPRQPDWHILVTSRQQINRFDMKELDFLSPDEAVALFRLHYDRSQIDDKEIRELVKLVDLHTLTIEILAKTAQRQRTEISELKKAIEKDLKANVYTAHSGDKKKIEKVTSYLSSIFNLSKLDENEIWLLKQFACLPPEFLSYELLKELINPETSQREDIFSETLEELVTKGWLLTNQASDTYKMHRIISDVIRKQKPVSLAEVESLIDRITEKLSIDQTKDNPVDKFPWITYGKLILDVFPDCSDAVISLLQNELALVLQDLGEYKEAKTLLKKALASAEKNFGPDHPTTAESYSGLGLVLGDLGEYKEAKTLLEKAVDSDEKNFGPDHPNTAVSYSNLATVLQDLGEYKEAKTLLKKALASAEKNFGPDHPTTAVRYSNLATVLEGLGDYKGATKLSQKALTVFQAKLPKGHTYIDIASQIYESIKKQGK